MENIGIDVKLIISQMVSFGVFYLVFMKFISRPLFRFLKKQKEQEELKEKLAQELEQRNAKLEEKDKAMNKTRKMALDVAILESKKEAQGVKEQIIADAKAQAENILAAAKSQIQEERMQMQKDMRKKIAQLCVVVVNKALHAYLTPQAKKEITKHIIEQAPKAQI